LVSWTVKKTIEWVMKAAEVERILPTSVKAAKMTYVGRILSKKGNCQGEIPGRPKTTWLDNIKIWIGRPVAHLTRTVEDREKWRKVVRDASNPRPGDG